jgi:hypothetical protein
MRKILATLIMAGLLIATSVAPARAEENYGISVFNPLWPVATALSIPAAVIASIVNPGATVPVILPTVPAPAPVVYSGPATYYVPGPYYAPRVYGGPTVYVGSRGYYAPRVYYPYRGYRVYERGR